MMENPCKNCEFLARSKHREECKRCEKKIAYVNSRLSKTFDTYEAFENIKSIPKAERAIKVPPTPNNRYYSYDILELVNKDRKKHITYPQFNNWLRRDRFNQPDGKDFTRPNYPNYWEKDSALEVVEQVNQILLNRYSRTNPNPDAKRHTITLDKEIYETLKSRAAKEKRTIRAQVEWEVLWYEDHSNK